MSLFASLGVALSIVVTANAAAPSSHTSAPAKACKKVKATGVIKYSDWQFPSNINVYQTSASVAWETWDLVYEPMVTYNSKGVAVPDLITALPKPTGGGKIYTVHLKKGLRWSNGQEITSADVKFSTAINNSADTGPYCSGGGCDSIARVDTPDKYTAVFHLKYPYAAFSSVALFNDLVWPSSWAGSNGWAKGDVAAAAKQLGQNAKYNFSDNTYPTNGPYQIKEFTLNERIVLAPMKYYHTMSCGGALSQLIFAFYASKEGLIAAAASKQTDVTTDYTLADVSGLRGKKSISTHVSAGYEIEQLHLNVDKTYNGKPNPLANQKVRLALALALDKYGLIQSALGVTRSAAASVIPWNFIIYAPSFKQPFSIKIPGQWDPLAKGGKGGYLASGGTPQAIADAKKLLAQAGYPNGGFSVDADTTSGNAVRQAEFSVIQNNWAKIGVGFTPNYVPAGKFFSDWATGSPLNHGAFQVAQFTDVGYPDPDTWETSLNSKYVDRDKTVHAATNANYSGIRDSVIDKDLAKASQTTVKSVRQKYYTDLQTRMAKEAYWIPEYYRPKIDTEDGKVAHFSQNPTNVGAEWNAWQWALKGKS